MKYDLKYELLSRFIVKAPLEFMANLITCG